MRKIAATLPAGKGCAKRRNYPTRWLARNFPLSQPWEQEGTRLGGEPGNGNRALSIRRPGNAGKLTAIGRARLTRKRHMRSRGHVGRPKGFADARLHEAGLITVQCSNFWGLAVLVVAPAGGGTDAGCSGSSALKTGSMEDLGERSRFFRECDLRFFRWTAGAGGNGALVNGYRPLTDIELLRWAS